MPDRPTRVLAVMGGIGSGKSAVARILEELGAVRIDADHLAREALEVPAVLAALQSRFGNRVLGADGGPDRTAIAAIVFQDPKELEFLENLVHPRVRSDIREQLKAAREAKACCVVLDVPLLIERSPFAAEVDDFIFVDCPADERLRRAAARHGWSAEEFARRETLQTPLSEKRRRAQVVIDNSQDLSALRSQVERWWEGIVPASEEGGGTTD